MTLMIQAFCEGLPLKGTEEVAMHLLSNTACGYELQFSLRSRAEALSMRSELLGRIFAMRGVETTSATKVGDVIRKIDIEVSRFSKLFSALPGHMDRQGLSIGDGDMMVILLRSLPEEAKQYVLRHSTGESYGACRTAALKFERQQRLFLDLNLGGRKQVSELYGSSSVASAPDIYSMACTDHDGSFDAPWYELNAVSRDRCEKCGKKHKTGTCSTGLSTVKCFSCGEFGRISARCPKKSSSSASSYILGKPSKGKVDKGKGKGKQDKGKGKGKDKGKKGGKGKKGKMFEVTGGSTEALPTDGAQAEEGWEESWDESWWWADMSAEQGGHRRSMDAKC